MTAALARALQLVTPPEPGGLHQTTERRVSPWQVLLVVLAVAALFAWPVPGGNELLYLLTPYRFWHHDFLARDWSMATNGSEHFWFNAIAGAIMVPLPLEVVGWLGRIVCWIVIVRSMLRLGTRLGLGGWEATFALVLWLMMGQTLVGGEWVLRGFEAKTVAYAFLFAGLHALLDGRQRRAGVLLGLCFTFHPSVGAIAGLAAFVAAKRLPMTLRQMGELAAFCVLFGLPGLLPVLPMVLHPDPTTSADWRFFALVRMPWHSDPLSFPRRDLVATYLLLTFNLVYAHLRRTDRVVRFLGDFQVVLGIVFTAGIVFRLVGAWSLLQTMPFRLLPLFTMVIFLLQVPRAWREATMPHVRALPPLVAALGLIALFSLPSPLSSPFDQLSDARVQWSKDDPIGDTFDWIAANTPTDALVILPPWRRDAFYRARRAQVANWGWPSVEHPGQWRARIEELVGSLDGRPMSALRELELAKRYAEVPEATARHTAAKYGATFVISNAAYAMPVLFESGGYKVYRVTPALASRVP